MLIGYYVGTLLTTVCGNIIPAYNTFKALQIDKETETSDEVSRWMQYWIVFSIFATFEYFIDCCGTFFPFFYEIKLAALLWLSLDKFKGASLVYTKFLEPTILAKQPLIDEKVALVKKTAANLKAEDINTFVNWATAQGSALASAAAPKAASPTPDDKPISDDEDKKEQ